MKKRIFTLLALAMLIGGTSSTLSAQQVSLDDVRFSYVNSAGFYERKVTKNAESPYVTDSKLSVTTIEVLLNGLNDPNTEKSVTVYFGGNETAGYLGLPKSYTFNQLDTIKSGTSKWVEVTIEHDWNMPSSINGTEGIVYASLDPLLINDVKSTKTHYGTTTIKFYNYPTFTVEYRATTTQYVGSLKVSNISGSNKDIYKGLTMKRKLKKDKDYSYLTDTTVLYPFNEIEVANLVIGDKIWVSTPWETYVLDIPGIDDDVPAGTIPRAITIPVVSGATLNVEPGIYQVPSTYDFSFEITPTGSNVGLVPKVKTGRTTIPDSEGVTYQQLPNGTWLVTILRVQTNMNLSIDFTTSNASVESNSVWANGGQLYVSAVTSSKANIYSITGALVKTAAISAGETANISLPTGFYVVTVNGKAYKVTVK